MDCQINLLNCNSRNDTTNTSKLMPFIESLPWNTLLWAGGLLLAVGVVWTLVRVTFKVTLRLFWTACLLVVILGTLGLLAASIAGGS